MLKYVFKLLSLCVIFFLISPSHGRYLKITGDSGSTSFISTGDDSSPVRVENSCVFIGQLSRVCLYGQKITVKEVNENSGGNFLKNFLSFSG